MISSFFIECFVYFMSNLCKNLLGCNMEERRKYAKDNKQKQSS